ncbi:MAG: acetyl-CoA carboxylase biotin carboxylase subunit, partial [Thermodesulfobacteriota bacterium]|nr:acetyl-CoA carboxylase biotin carboxylase subunit [Thermodesulfobacteriota bacterium]
KSIAREVGMPVILKSLYGGGGRGMKIAHTEDQIEMRFNNAQSEAMVAFGRGEVYVEHYILSPKHLEIQCICDRWGNIRILGDRECSIQRRHQKIIEEAPASNIDPILRARLGEWTRKIMSSIEFRGLGTAEFLMDEKGEIFFLEINGRLQVEHPVTEMVTGIDLVRQQFMVAAGERIKTGSAKVAGHAIECRINAEDPHRNFMPTTGRVVKLRLPSGPGARVDTHLFPGCVVSPFYDPLLAKLIAHDSTRSRAIQRISRMLHETRIQGLTTNRELLKTLLENQTFIEGNSHTALVKQILKQ